MSIKDQVTLTIVITFEEEGQSEFYARSKQMMQIFVVGQSSVIQNDARNFLMAIYDCVLLSEPPNPSVFVIWRQGPFPSGHDMSLGKKLVVDIRWIA